MNTPLTPLKYSRFTFNGFNVVIALIDVMLTAQHIKVTPPGKLFNNGKVFFR